MDSQTEDYHQKGSRKRMTRSWSLKSLIIVDKSTNPRVPDSRQVFNAGESSVLAIKRLLEIGSPDILQLRCRMPTCDDEAAWATIDFRPENLVFSHRNISDIDDREIKEITLTTRFGHARTVPPNQIRKFHESPLCKAMDEVVAALPRAGGTSEHDISIVMAAPLNIYLEDWCSCWGENRFDYMSGPFEGYFDNVKHFIDFWKFMINQDWLRNQMRMLKLDLSKVTAKVQELAQEGLFRVVVNFPKGAKVHHNNQKKDISTTCGARYRLIWSSGESQGSCVGTVSPMDELLSRHDGSLITMTIYAPGLPKNHATYGIELMLDTTNKDRMINAVLAIGNVLNGDSKDHPSYQLYSLFVRGNMVMREKNPADRNAGLISKPSLAWVPFQELLMWMGSLLPDYLKPIAAKTEQTDLEEKIAELQRRLLSQAPLSKSQQNAAELAISNPLTVIHGLPGTGKTQLSFFLAVALAAPHAKMNLPTEQDCGHTTLLVTSSNSEANHYARLFHEIQQKDVDLKRLRIVRYLASSALNPLSQDSDGNAADIIIDRTGESIGFPYEMSLDFQIEQNHPEYTEMQNRFVHGMTPQERATFYKAKNIWTKQILKKADVVISTVTAVGSNEARSSLKVETVIHDEAAHATEPETLIPLSLPGIVRLVLIGQREKLRRSVQNCVKPLEQSAFERLLNTYERSPTDSKINLATLRLNRWSPPEIVSYISDTFYEGQLFCEKPQDRTPDAFSALAKNWGVESSILWYDVPNNSACDRTQSHSRENYENAAALYVLLKSLEMIDNEKQEDIKGGRFSAVTDTDIVILTPYRGQANLLSLVTRDAGDRFANVEVETIENFLGREKKYIILDFTRNDSKRFLGVLDDPQRLNLAVSRAKHKLIIIGDWYWHSGAFRKGNRFVEYKQLHKLVMLCEDRRVHPDELPFKDKWTGARVVSGARTIQSQADQAGVQLEWCE